MFNEIKPRDKKRVLLFMSIAIVVVTCASLSYARLVAPKFVSILIPEE